MNKLMEAFKKDRKKTSTEYFYRTSFTGELNSEENGIYLHKLLYDISAKLSLLEYREITLRLGFPCF